MLCVVGGFFPRAVKNFVLSCMFCSLLFSANAAGKNFWKGVQVGIGVTAGVTLGVLGATFLASITSKPYGVPADSSDHEIESSKPETTFEDVIIPEEVSVEIKEDIDILKNFDRYKKVGARGHKGVLLYGPSGCGKTLIARAIAGETNSEFISVSGAEFVNVYVGSGAANVRALFNYARELAEDKQVIIFIDEIDSLGRRTSTEHSGTSVYNGAINEMLNQMDGFKKDNILVIAATNFIDEIDPALLRPGRFDRKIYVPAPTRQGREKILSHYLKKVVLAESLSVDDLSKDYSRRTAAFSGASLENFVNESAILAAREKKEAVEKAHFEAALDKVVMGIENKAERTDEQLKSTSYHEAGHALIALLYDLPVHKVSILSRGNVLGVTKMSGKYEEYSYYKRSEILHEIACTQGGFAAEKFVFGEVSPGVSRDLKNAALMASGMVKRFGMGEGPAEGITWHAFGSKEGAKELNNQVISILKESLKRTTDLITKHQDLLHVIANELIKHEEICEKRLYELVGDRRGCERSNL
jgi:cell division protease FtsH